ncbi:hypothetical protein K474DRAFT_1665218 [Panus rudis PR-1116 ss-1]|nr:hypothetical protein K474DRAFT_1665218 [Panus rudis PR-1116 ss-1]
MAPLFNLPIILLLVAGCCLAEIVSLQKGRDGAANQITDLSTRVRRDSGYSFGTGSGSLGEEQNTELLDIVLVASVDGKLHALNRTSGRSLWSMSSPVSGDIPPTLGPLIRTQHAEIDPDLTDDDSKDQEVYVIEPQSGEIYVMSTPDAPLQRLPFTMPQLVDMSPFSFSGEGDNRVFVGRKETALLLVELETGRVKATLDSECPWDPFEDMAEQSTEDDLDLDELEGSKPSKPKPKEVFIGRTDYHISIRTRPSSRTASKPPVQKLSFSIYGPNNQDTGLQALYRRTPDNKYIESLPNGKVFSFRANEIDGDLSAPAVPQPLWAHAFPKPIVAVFDVLRNPDREHPFVLLQPRPRLQEILPGIDLANPAKANQYPNMESAYVGLVEETGSLFAMSPDRFPLMIFGETNREEDDSYLGNGIRGVGRSIDPPPTWDWDSEGDLPPDVDSVAKHAKLKQYCRTKDGKRDVRCLTGVRKLESSRLSRLLDGAPSLVPPPPPTNHQQHNSGDVFGPGASGSIINPAADNRDGNGNSSIIPPLSGIVPGVSATATSKTLSAIAVCTLALLSVVWVFVKRKKLSPIQTITAPSVVKANGHLPIDVKVDRENTSLTSVPTSDPASTEKHRPPAMDLNPSPPSRTSSPAPITPPANTSTPRKVVFIDSDEATPKLTAGLSATSTPAPKSPPTPGPGVEGDEGEGDESDGDAAVTPGRRKPARRKRGKKKKGGGVGGANGQAEEGGQEEKEKDGVQVQGEVKEEEEKEKEQGKAANVLHVVSPSALVVPPPSTPTPVVPSLVVSDTVLGFGSHGTVVFKGNLQGRAVAVKRLLRDFVTLADREVNILQESDDHPNVIRYYYQESQGNFLYIALELCPASLADVIERPDQFRDIAIAFEPKRALRQITSGLRHLHALKIVHRDIKPHNILISHAKKGVGESAGHRMLISDFGLCKKLEVDQTSFLPTAHGAMAAGTVGWRAPEILRGEVKLDEPGAEDSLSSRGSVGSSLDGGGTPTGRPTRLTKAVDIFALGCLFYYVLSNGGHPFGDRFERESNIWKNAKNLDALERFGEEGSEAVDLISKMIHAEASERPDTSTCLLHPYFWDPGKRLNFLQDASDRFEIMCRDPRDPILIELERDALNVVGPDWNARLDKWFIENLGKFRKYDGKSVQDLLRALRNKKHHYQDLPDNVKRQVGPMPEGFLSYFTRRFPRLFLHVHGVIAASSLRNESMFRTYFELSD